MSRSSLQSLIYIIIIIYIYIYICIRLYILEVLGVILLADLLRVELHPIEREVDPFSHDHIVPAQHVFIGGQRNEVFTYLSVFYCYISIYTSESFFKNAKLVVEIEERKGGHLFVEIGRHIREESGMVVRVESDGRHIVLSAL